MKKCTTKFTNSKTIFFAILLLCFFRVNAQISVIRAAGAGQNWTNSNNITAADAAVATTTVSFNNNSPYLYASNFGFSIPTGATITGIQARITRRGSNLTNGVRDVDVYVTPTGTPAGTNLAQATIWPTSLTQAIYGTSTSLWGQTWTPAQINATTFGVLVRVTAPFANRVAAVDFVDVIVHYSIPPSITNFTPLQTCENAPQNVTINGSNFINVTGVWIGSTPVPFNVLNSNTILIPSPIFPISGVITVNTLTGTAIHPSTFTVHAAPAPAPISGPNILCTGNAVTYTSSPAGGVWTSSNPLVAQVSPLGLVNALASGTTTLQYTVTNAAGCSAIVSKTVQVSGTPVSITTAPSNLSACAGTSAVFSVSASGNGLSYQWFKDGVALSNSGNYSGAQTANLTISPVASADAAMYTCTVSGPCGSATSPGAELTVVEPVVVTTQPSSLHLCTGDTATFNITHSGSATSYQWYNNGSIITDGGRFSGSTTNTLNIANITTSDASANYYCIVTPFSPCSPVQSTSVSLTVDSPPVILNQPPLVTTVCAGDPAAISVAATGGNLSFQWYKGGVALTDSALISGSNTDTLYFTAASLADAASDYYVVIDNVCTGTTTSSNAQIVVNEIPVIPSQTITVCSGQPFTVDPQNGVPNAGTIVPAGTIYSWSLPAVTGGVTGGSAGSAAANITQTLINPTNTVQTATYLITPQSGTVGNCTGVPFTVVVTVNPVPQINNLTATYCSGEAFAFAPSSGGGNSIPAGTTYSWPTPVVTGGLTGGSAGNNQTSVSQTLVNPTNSTQTATYTLTATSGSCLGATFTLTVSIAPQPTTAAAPASQNVCSGGPISPILFSNPNSVPGITSYIWNRDNLANVSGIPASGNGTISGILNNTTGVPQVVTFTYQGISAQGCVSTTGTATIRVDPVPVVIPSVPTQTICSGQAISTVGFSTINGVTGVTYSWVRTNDTNITGIPTSGSGPVTGTLSNLTSVPQTTTFTVTASASGCTSTTTFTVIVNPEPTLSVTPSSQTICSGTPISGIAALNLNSIAGVTFSWSRNNTTAVTGIPASGTGSLVTGTLHNTTGTDQTVVFTFTASAGGCLSASTTATVIVRAQPSLAVTPVSQNICNNATAAITINDINNVSGVSISWTRTNTTNVTGIAASGTGTSISGVLTNTTSVNQTVQFTITATAPSGCVSTATATIIVFPAMTAPVIATNQAVCAGSTPLALYISTPPTGSGTFTYQWQSGPSASGPWTNVGTGLTYQPPAVNLFSNNTYYQLVVNGCSTMTSNVVLIEPLVGVNTTFTVNDGIPTSGNTICSDTSFSPTITSDDNLISYALYSWSLNPANFSPATGGWIGTQLPGGFLGINVYTTATIPLTAINTTNASVTVPVSIIPRMYIRFVNTPLCSLTPRSFNITIRPRPVATATGNTTICSGTPAGIPVTGNITDATMSFAYTRFDTNSAVTSSMPAGSSGTVAVGGTFVINDILTNSTTSIQTVTYQITPTSGWGCTGTPILVSINVNPMLTPGTLSADQVICTGGDPAEITEISAPTGGTLYSFQWFSGPSASGPWSAIGGATGTTYNPPAGPASTIWYVRQVTSVINGVTCQVQNSAPVRIAVNSINPGAIAGNQTICGGSSVSTLLSTTSATGAGIISYQWQSSTTGCSGPWTNIPLATGATYNPGIPTQTTWYRRTGISTLNGAPCQSESNCVVVNVNTVTAAVIGSDQAICGNDPDAINSLTSATGSGTLTYQWQSNTVGCTGPWTNIPGPAAQNPTYDPPAGVTVTTYYRMVVTSTLNGVSCSQSSNCITVIASPVTSGTISGNRTVCSGGDPAGFTESMAATGATNYRWQLSTVGTGGPWTDIVGATSALYDHPGPVFSTTYFRRIATATTAFGSCDATSNVVTVFVNNVTPPVITGAQTLCGSLDPAPITISTPAVASGTLQYQWQRSLNGCSGPWSNLAGETGPLLDPASITQTTTYQLVVTSVLNGVNCTAISNCVTVVSNSKIWTGTSGNNWNVGTNWSPPGVPDATHCVIIPNVVSDPVISGTGYIADAYSLTVLPGGRLDVLASNTLKVVNVVNVQPLGNLFVNNNASLVQVDDVNNSGSIVVERTTQPMYRFDFTYWGSMMEAGSYTLGMLSPNTLHDKFFSWTPTISGGAGNWHAESMATVMIPGKGYIVRAPQHFSVNPAITTPYTAYFNGTPENGSVNVPISIGTLGAGQTADKLNLIANPFPSAVDADLFLSDPTNSGLLDGTIYFWTHHEPPSAAFPNPFYGTFTLNYSPNGYAAYNLSGGVGTAPSGYATIPDGTIASAQGFFVKGIASGTALFNNSMRISGNNSTFFRMQSIEKHRIWLNMGNEQSAFGQLLLGYVEGATDGIDRAFDGTSMNGGQLSFYSLADGQQLQIQGRSVPFNHTDEIPLGFTTVVSGNFTIGIDQLDGDFATQDVFLEDKLLGVYHNLKSSAYSFITESGSHNNRFILRYGLPLTNVSPEEEQGTIAFIAEELLQIQSPELVENVQVFDMAGRELMEVKPTASGIIRIPFVRPQGMYLVKIHSAVGNVTKILQN